MALNRVGVMALIVTLAACGPQISPEQLPALQSVSTDGFLQTVKDQLDELKTATSSDPLNADKAGLLGMTYLAYQLDGPAETALQRARLLQPRKFDWMYYHAEALTRLGRLDEARDVLLAAIDRKPRYASARIHLGSLYMQLGELEPAELHLRQVIEKRPANVEGRLALARLFLRADKPDKALEHLEYLVSTENLAGSVYFTLADAWRRLGDQEKAAENLQLFEKYRSVGLGINDPLMQKLSTLDISEKPLLRLARRLNQMGQTDKAIETLHLALARNPDSDLTHAALVGAYGALKQFDKVDEHYQRALASAPPTSPLLRNLGRARYYENRMAEASEALEQALVRNPHDASTLAWLGLVRIRQNKAAAGIDLLIEALEKNPGETMARHNLVSTLRLQGRHAEALPHMTVLLQVPDKHSPRVWREMGESYLLLGQTTQARVALTAAVSSAEQQKDEAEVRRSANLLQKVGN